MPSPDRKVYKLKDFTINVQFRDGRSVREMIWKSDGSKLEPHVILTLLKILRPT